MKRKKKEKGFINRHFRTGNKSENEFFYNAYVYIPTWKESFEMLGVNHIIVFKCSIDKMSINIKKKNFFFLMINIFI
jgi:hypothetical protein